MFTVFAINKNNRQKAEVIASGVSEEEAIRICEQWGWNYCNEHGQSFWLDYEEE